MDWVYKYYGAIGLLPRKNQSYSVAFKLNVLKSNCQRFIVFRDSSLKFNIGYWYYFKWKKDFANFGLEGLLKPKADQEP
jgi:transposase